MLFLLGFGAAGLWLAPKIITYYGKKDQAVQAVVTTSKIFPHNAKKDQRDKAVVTSYHRSLKTTFFAILALQGFGLAIGFILFGYVVGSQPPSTYPVFGYGKPPPIVIDGFSSYYWAIPSVIAGFVFSYLAYTSTLISCTNCGHINPSMSLFCNKCAHSIVPKS